MTTKPERRTRFRRLLGLVLLVGGVTGLAAHPGPVIVSTVSSAASILVGLVLLARSRRTRH